MLFRKRNKAGTAQGPVVEANPHNDLFSSWDAPMHPIDKGLAEAKVMERNNDGDREIARRMEKVRQSHGPEARY
jgi:hypothetical protein